MSTLVHFHLGALIHVTVQRLVGFVGTICDFIADKMALDALTIVATELGFVRAGCVFFFTIYFVRMIAAIVFSIASILVPNALKVLASKFVCSASLVLRIAFLAFISSIATVVVVIA